MLSHEQNNIEVFICKDDVSLLCGGGIQKNILKDVMKAYVA
jgi:hypothetical protein